MRTKAPVTTDPITSIDRAIAKQIGLELAALAQVIGNRYGVNVINKGGRFNDDSLTCKIEFTIQSNLPATPGVTDSPLVPNDRDKRTCRMLGLPEDIVGKSFHHKTKTMTVTGLNPSRPKNAISLEDQNGKKFKCSVSLLKSMMGI